MIRSKIVPADEQLHYWSVVQRCLTEFHRLTESAARKKVRQCQKEVEQLPQATAEFFFHAEPFDIACRIAESELDVTNFLTRYLEIRDQPEKKRDGTRG